MANDVGGIIGGIISGVGDIGVNIANSYMQGEIARRNFENQQEAWRREDTAVQRRVADLKAAGLSPVLAAGSAAQSSTPIKVEAPQYRGPGPGTSILESVSAVQALQLQRAQVQQTAAQTELIKMQQRRTGAEADFLEQTIDERVAVTGLNRQSIETALNFAKSVNPERLKQIGLQNEDLSVKVINDKLQSEALRLGIDESKLDIIAKQVQNALSKSSLGARFSAINTEANIKQLILENLSVDVSSKTKKLGFWEGWTQHMEKAQDIFNLLNSAKSLLK